MFENLRVGQRIELTCCFSHHEAYKPIGGVFYSAGYQHQNCEYVVIIVDRTLFSRFLSTVEFNIANELRVSADHVICREVNLPITDFKISQSSVDNINLDSYVQCHQCRAVRKQIYTFTCCNRHFICIDHVIPATTLDAFSMTFMSYNLRTAADMVANVELPSKELIETFSTANNMDTVFEVCSICHDAWNMSAIKELLLSNRGHLLSNLMVTSKPLKDQFFVGDRVNIIQNTGKILGACCILKIPGKELYLFYFDQEINWKQSTLLWQFSLKFSVPSNFLCLLSKQQLSKLKYESYSVNFSYFHCLSQDSILQCTYCKFPVKKKESFICSNNHITCRKHLYPIDVEVPVIYLENFKNALNKYNIESLFLRTRAFISYCTLSDQNRKKMLDNTLSFVDLLKIVRQHKYRICKICCSSYHISYIHQLLDCDLEIPSSFDVSTLDLNDMDVANKSFPTGVRRNVLVEKRDNIATIRAIKRKDSRLEINDRQFKLSNYVKRTLTAAGSSNSNNIQDSSYDNVQLLQENDTTPSLNFKPVLNVLPKHNPQEINYNCRLDISKNESQSSKLILTREEIQFNACKENIHEEIFNVLQRITNTVVSRNESDKIHDDQDQYNASQNITIDNLHNTDVLPRIEVEVLDNLLLNTQLVSDGENNLDDDLIVPEVELHDTNLNTIEAPKPNCYVLRQETLLNQRIVEKIDSDCTPFFDRVENQPIETLAQNEDHQLQSDRVFLIPKSEESLSKESVVFEDNLQFQLSQNQRSGKYEVKTRAKVIHKLKERGFQDEHIDLCLNELTEEHINDVAYLSHLISEKLEENTIARLKEMGFTTSQIQSPRSRLQGNEYYDVDLIASHIIEKICNQVRGRLQSQGLLIPPDDTIKNLINESKITSPVSLVEIITNDSLNTTAHNRQENDEFNESKRSTEIIPPKQSEKLCQNVGFDDPFQNLYLLVYNIQEAEWLNIEINTNMSSHDIFSLLIHMSGVIIQNYDDLILLQYSDKSIWMTPVTVNKEHIISTGPAITIYIFDLENFSRIIVSQLKYNIGPPFKLCYLSEPYKFNRSIQEKILGLEYVYEGWRSIRGDGNCYYRSIYFALIEQIIQSSNRDTKFRKLANIFKRSRSKDDDDRQYVLAIVNFLESAAGIPRILISLSWIDNMCWKTLEEFEADANLNQFCDRALINILRTLVANFSVDYKNHLFNGLALEEIITTTYSVRSMEKYCELFIFNNGEDAEGPIVDLGILIHILNCDGCVVLLDRRDNVNVSFLNPSPYLHDIIPLEEPILGDLHLLLRPGHYDLLYLKK